MARKKAEITEEASADSSIAQLTSYLKKNKEDHLNFEKEVDWVVPTGSLLLDVELGGGVRPGAYKMHGASFAGKSSSVAQIFYNFLKQFPEDGKGLWIKAEGRLDKEFKERSGVKFVYDPSEWVGGTCFVYESNVFESATDLVNELVRNNPDRYKYMMAIDSMDNLIRREDIKKESAQSEKVGAAGLLTSTMFKKVNLVLNKMGHCLFMIQQVRSKIDVNQYAPKDQNKSVGGGGSNAGTHNANQIWEFQGRTKARNIEENGNVVGHKCAVKFTKGVRERVDALVEYPVKHGRKGGNSVWLEYEIADLLIQWDMINKSGTWLYLSEELVKELREAGFEIEEGFKVQGDANLKGWLEENPEITQFLYKKFLNLIVY